MTDELKFPDADAREPLDERLKTLVREAYSPPVSAAGADAYWAGIEQRIMSRVSAESTDRSWLSELAPWARLGLAAAAAIFALTSVINQQMTDLDEQVAYEAVVQPDLSSVSEEPIAAQYVPAENGASALRYYLSN